MGYFSPFGEGDFQKNRWNEKKTIQPFYNSFFYLPVLVLFGENRYTNISSTALFLYISFFGHNYC